MASQVPRPGSGTADAAPEPDLDEQIRRAEEAVIARDSRIRRRTDLLVQRVKSDALRHAGSGVALGALAIALAWWFKRRRKPPAAAAAAPAAAEEDGDHLLRDAGFSLAGLLPLIWPMLPRSWRRGVTPDTASTVLTLCAPLLARLFRRRPKAAAAP